MQIKTLHLVQLEYEKTIENILPYFYSDLNKNQQIRIRQWIKKLSSVINNLLWRRNRNLYAKLLLAMLKTKNGLLQPFNKNPPQASLPKLSIYDIPYNLRVLIQNSERQNQNNEKILRKERRVSLKGEEFENKQNKRMNYDQNELTLQKSTQKNKKQKQNRVKNSVNNIFQLEQTKKKSNKEKTICLKQSQLNCKQQLQQISSLVNESLEFLKQHYQQILIDQNYKNSKSNQVTLKQIVSKINSFKYPLSPDFQTTNYHKR